MGSLGTGELILIALVALIVFGPQRLPELARKAGELLAKAREATRSMTDALDSEYDGMTAPIRDLKTEYDATMNELKKTASSVAGLSVELPKGNKADDSPQPTAESQQQADDSSEAADSRQPTADGSEAANSQRPTADSPAAADSQQPTAGEADTQDEADTPDDNDASNHDDGTS
ncbi:MAG: hypothetical protein BMS9Abin20_0896 [Acidimicrobiia bacterium]|nr:MAG: hypothetical protein BMS9Abin20_0896 [Acidimicrobiia bacterium]